MQIAFSNSFMEGKAAYVGLKIVTTKGDQLFRNYLALLEALSSL